MNKNHRYIGSNELSLGFKYLKICVFQLEFLWNCKEVQSQEGMLDLNPIQAVFSSCRKKVTVSGLISCSRTDYVSSEDLSELCSQFVNFLRTWGFVVHLREKEEWLVV